MTTLLVIILIIALIVGIIQSKNYDDIMGLSRVELVEKKRKQSRKMLVVLVLSITALVIGILLYKYTDMHKIVQVKTIFGKVKDAFIGIFVGHYECITVENFDFFDLLGIWIISFRHNSLLIMKMRVFAQVILKDC